MNQIHEQLQEVSINSIDGKQCYAEVVGLESHFSDEVRMVVRLPSGKFHKQTFDLPQVDSEEYELVRVLNYIGCGLMRSEDAVGSEVLVELTEDGPKIKVPDKSTSVKARESVTRTFNVFQMVFLFPMWWAQEFKRRHNKRWTYPPDFGDWAVAWGMPTLAWSAVMAFIIFVVIDSLL